MPAPISLPHATSLLSVASAETTRLLRNLALRGAISVDEASTSAVTVLIQTGLVEQVGDQLFRVNPDTNRAIISSIIDHWLPGVYDTNPKPH